MSEGAWRGAFGRDYLERNRDAGRARWAFWRTIQNQFPLKSLLEVGCGSGNNLQWILNRKAGVDVYSGALALARQRCPTAMLSVARATALPFRDRTFDCVLTCGLLIHIPPVELTRVMDELWRVSQKYLLIMEYHSERETMIGYRDLVDMLWKRPYAKWFGERFNLTSLARGFLGRERGFDDVHWDLWQKS